MDHGYSALRFPCRPVAGLLTITLLFGGLADRGMANQAAADPADKKTELPGPKVGETAKDFELASVKGKKVKLSEQVKQGPVVLVVLRGYPGYQCPLCTAQAGEFLGRIQKFREAGARLLFVYPGADTNLKELADEFLTDLRVPEGASVLLDPNYVFTKAYGLRWDAPNETAYPATYVIDRERIIRFAKVSRSHGGRAKSEEVLEALSELKPQKSPKQ